MHLLRQYGTTVAISRDCGIVLPSMGFETDSSWRCIVNYRKRVVAKQRYDVFVTNHGGVLQRSAEGRNLDAFIRRHWRSTPTFRRTHGIRVLRLCPAHRWGGQHEACR
jgi:hypothetical protein